MILNAGTNDAKPSSWYTNLNECTNNAGLTHDNDHHITEEGMARMGKIFAETLNELTKDKQVTTSNEILKKIIDGTFCYTNVPKYYFIRYVASELLQARERIAELEKQVEGLVSLSKRQLTVMQMYDCEYHDDNYEDLLNELLAAPKE